MVYVTTLSVLYLNLNPFCSKNHCFSPPSLSLARCVCTAFALLWPVLSMCLFSGLSDLRSILQGGVTSEESRIFSCLWSPPGWLLDEYLRVCGHKFNPSLLSFISCMQWVHPLVFIRKSVKPTLPSSLRSSLTVYIMSDDLCINVLIFQEFICRANLYSWS